MTTPRTSTPRGRRIAGALLGVHAGDSLGATAEFESWAAIRARWPRGLRDVVGGGVFAWPAGHATDDTDLTRAVLLAYLDRRADPGVDVVRRAADHMLAWFDGDWPGRRRGEAPRDVGTATRVGLSNYRRDRDPSASGAGVDSAGNGSLMRCIPTALAHAGAGQRRAEARRISAVTHDDPRCTAACAAYVEIAAALVDGADAADAVRAGHATARALADDDPAASPVPAAFDVAVGLSLADVVETGRTDVVGHGRGYVLSALMLAVAAVLDPRPLEDVVVDVVRIGEDTDTNAAIAGGLLGARDGLDAIPHRWLDRLQFRDEFLAASAALAQGD